MSADIVNLRQARKRRDRAAGVKQGEENRAKFGRTKRERKEHDANAALEQSRLDAHRRQHDDDPPPNPIKPGKP